MILLLPVKCIIVVLWAVSLRASCAASAAFLAGQCEELKSP